MVRGVAGCKIFIDDLDRESFIKRADRVFKDTSTQCLSWSLMDTHVHMLPRTGVKSISHVMQRLLTGYAMDFNRRFDRQGHLFQGRFKSPVVEESSYLDELIRYINLNPLRANMVSDLDELADYRWTSFSALMGNRPRKLIAVDEVLSRFGPNWSIARHQLRDWLQAGLDHGTKDPMQGQGFASHRPELNRPGLAFNGRVHTKVLGDEDFVKRLLAEASTEEQTRERLRRLAWSPDAIVAWTCNALGVELDALLAGRKLRECARARAIIAYLLVDGLGVKTFTAASHLGVSASAISKIRARGRELYKRSGLDLPKVPSASDPTAEPP